MHDDLGEVADGRRGNHRPETRRTPECGTHRMCSGHAHRHRQEFCEHHKVTVGAQHHSGAAVAGLPVGAMLSHHADSVVRSAPRREDIGVQHGRRGRVEDHLASRP